MIRAVSLLTLSQTAVYLKASYWAVVVSQIIWGLLTVCFPQKMVAPRAGTGSVLLQILAVLLFILSAKPYAAALSFLFLILKAVLIIKKP